MNVAQRLARLERENRIYRSLFLLAGLCIVALVIYLANKPVLDVIRARSFEIINEDGKIAGEFSVNTLDGSGSLSINNSDARGMIGHSGKIVLNLITQSGDGWLQVGTKKGWLHLGGIWVESGNILVFHNKALEKLVTISVDEYGNGMVGAYNRKGIGRTLQPGP